MAVYQLRERNNQFVVTQWSVSLALFGLMALAISVMVFYWQLRATSELSNTDFWTLLIVSVGVFVFGVYAVFQPFRFEAIFDETNHQLTVISKGFFKSKKSLYSYAEIVDFIMIKSDNDGYWYQPIIMLENKSQLKFGFGYGVEAPVREMVEKSRRLLGKIDSG